MRAIHDGFATIRAGGNKRGRSRSSPSVTVPSPTTTSCHHPCCHTGTSPTWTMEPLWEERGGGQSHTNTVARRDRSQLPWWEVATRRSRYRSCPTFSQVSETRGWEQMLINGKKSDWDKQVYIFIWQLFNVVNSIIYINSDYWFQYCMHQVRLSTNYAFTTIHKVGEGIKQAVAKCHTDPNVCSEDICEEWCVVEFEMDSRTLMNFWPEVQFIHRWGLDLDLVPPVGLPYLLSYVVPN